MKSSPAICLRTTTTTNYYVYYYYYYYCCYYYYYYYYYYYCLRTATASKMCATIKIVCNSVPMMSVFFQRSSFTTNPPT